MSSGWQCGGRVLVLGFALLGGCGDGTEEASVPPSRLSVEFRAPADMAATRGDLGIVLDVRGGSPDRVDLYVEESWVARLDSASYRWDTRDWAEGEYALTARAVSGAQVFTSPVRRVVVDRSPPRLVSHQPETGSESARKRDPILLEFSEPLAPTALNSVWLEVQAVGQTPRTLTVTRQSEDRKTLVFVDATEAVPPYFLSVVLRGQVADDLGNQGALRPETWFWKVSAP